MKVPKIGKTSIQYKLGMFPMKNPDNILSANMTHGYFPNDLDFKELADHFETDASCIGESAHVLVDPHAGNRPSPIPEDWKKTLSKLTWAPSFPLFCDMLEISILNESFNF